MTREVITTALGVHILYDYLIKRGISKKEIEDSTGIKPRDLGDPDKGIPLRQFLNLWEMGVEISNDQALTIHLTRLYAKQMMHFVVHLAISSESMLSAFRHWSIYLKTICELDRVDIRYEEDLIFIRYTNTSPDYQNPWIPEHYHSLAVEYGRIFTEKEFNPIEVRFQHPARGDLKVYEQFFKAPVLFDQNESSSIFHRDTLESKLTTHNPSLLSILEKHADVSVSNLSDSRPFQARVQEHVVRMLSECSVSVDTISENMNMARSTLHRKLKQEGTTFTEILVQVRKNLSQHYLQEGFSCIQITNLLGFSEPSAFYHAYKRWFGKSPRDTSQQSYS